MIRNILKLTWRNFYKDKAYSLTNLAGLSIGIAVYFLIFQHALYQMSYDNFHANGENIYRVSRHSYSNNEEVNSALTFYGIGPETYYSFPEVENFSRLHRADGMITYHDTKGHVTSFFEQNAFYVDTSFFKIFSFPLIHGNSDQLTNPHSVFISESTAKKYFGSQNPLGKQLELATEWEGGNYIIEGVFKDVPQTSHMVFDFIFPIQNLLNNFQFRDGGWVWVNFYTYLLLAPGTDTESLELKLSGLVEKHLGSALRNQNNEMSFQLQPLKKIFLHSSLTGEVKENGSWEILKILLAAAFFIIGLAWLNYINLSTARAIQRTREIGIRKVLGSSRLLLVKQFLLESFILNIIAVFIAVIFLFISYPFIKGLIDIEILINPDVHFSYWILFIGIFIVGTYLSGIYPAIFISSFKPVRALKGTLTSNDGNKYSRQVLITFQFIASLILMVGAVVIFSQVKLLQQQDLGINIEQKIVLEAPRTVTGRSYWQSLAYFKNEIIQNSNISNAAISFEVPGHGLFWGAEIRLDGWPIDKSIVTQRTSFDPDFIPSYKIQLLAGRNFSKTFEGPTAILNESALKALGFNNPEDAIGIEISDGWIKREVIGVIKDYHQQSPKFKVEPLIISPFSKEKGYITVSLQDKNIEGTLAYLEKTFISVFPANAFNYFFLDEYFNRQYNFDRKFGKVLTLFTILAMFIAGLGMMGLASFLIQTRSKEVGTRKVLGATSYHILYLFNKGIIKLIILGGLISLPFTYFISQKWLENFETRIDLHLVYFLFPFLVILMVSVGIISLKVWKFANTNPTKLLRIE